MEGGEWHALTQCTLDYVNAMQSLGISKLEDLLPLRPTKASTPPGEGNWASVWFAAPDF